MSNYTIKIKSERIKEILKKFGPEGNLINEVAGALTTEAWVILGEALPLTPLEFGPLRASQHVKPPVINGSTVSVSFGFGGPAAPYAWFVHEMPDSQTNWTTPGTGSKYLERPLIAALPSLGSITGGNIVTGTLRLSGKKI